MCQSNIKSLNYKQKNSIGSSILKYCFASILWGLINFARYQILIKPLTILWWILWWVITIKSILQWSFSLFICFKTFFIVCLCFSHDWLYDTFWWFDWVLFYFIGKNVDFLLYFLFFFYILDFLLYIKIYK